MQAKWASIHSLEQSVIFLRSFLKLKKIREHKLEYEQTVVWLHKQ